MSYDLVSLVNYFPTQVATHHEDLLSQAASANNLSGSITSVRGGLSDLDSSLEK